jgi:hypothetical protein
MIEVMGLSASAFAAGTLLFLGKDDDIIINDIENIKYSLRRCERDYLVFEQEYNSIPTKITELKNTISQTNKLYDMVIILEKEWNIIKNNMEKFKQQQEGSSMYYIG